MTTNDGRMQTLEAEVRSIDRKGKQRRAHLEWVGVDDEAREVIEAFVAAANEAA